MIIILILSMLVVNVLCFSVGFREGRYKREEQIKKSYVENPLLTRDYLIGKAETLPPHPWDFDE